MTEPQLKREPIDLDDVNTALPVGECCVKCRFFRSDETPEWLFYVASTDDADPRSWMAIDYAEPVASRLSVLHDGTTCECRRYPPQFLVELAEEIGDSYSRGYFPGVHLGDWCGEFQPRERHLTRTEYNAREGLA